MLGFAERLVTRSPQQRQMRGLDMIFGFITWSFIR
jgi:hypothetical protein